MITPRTSPKRMSRIDALRARLIRTTSIIEIEQHYLVSTRLGPDSVVVDLGANRGRFTRQVQELFNCRVVAIEPEESNFAAILPGKKIVKVRAAVSGHCGTISLNVSDESTAHSIIATDDTTSKHRNQHVPLYDYNALVRAAGLDRIDLLKVDIEGCEWDFFDAMSDAQLRAIGQITVEFHDFLPAFRETNRTWPVYQRLARLGFRCIEDPLYRSYNVLFVNKRNQGVKTGDESRLTLLNQLLHLSWKLNRLSQRLRRSS